MLSLVRTHTTSAVSSSLGENNAHVYKHAGSFSHSDTIFIHQVPITARLPDPVWNEKFTITSTHNQWESNPRSLILSKCHPLDHVFPHRNQTARKFHYQPVSLKCYLAPTVGGNGTKLPALFWFEQHSQVYGTSVLNKSPYSLFTSK